METKSWFVRTGDFFFKYRNYLFPLVIVALTILRPPVHEYEGQEGLEDVKDWIAVGVVVAGLALRAVVIGFRYIKRGGVNKKVYAAKLVTDGFFGVCRNPLYVGNIIISSGVLLMHGDPLVIVVGLAFFLFVYSAIVAAEEFFLRGQFGGAYAAYCRDVPRWGFRLGHLREATEGMRFNMRRVIAKDYTTMANAFMALLGLELLEQLVYPEGNSQQTVFFLFGSIVALLLGSLLIRTAKKRGLLTT